MVSLETVTRREDGITFVEVTLSNDGPDPRLVRIESRLDGPVWPPRTESVPAAGWDPDAGTLTASLSAGDSTGIGFATPAEPVEPPVSVLEERPAPTDDAAIGDSPAAVVRALGDPSPPDDALPYPPPDGGGDADGRKPDSSGSDTPGDTGESDGPSGPDAPSDFGDASDTSDTSTPGDTDDPDETPAGGYPAVKAWLAAVEGRIERSEGKASGERGERKGEREKESERETGDAPSRARLVADARRLRTVGRRAVELAERAAELSPEGPR